MADTPERMPFVGHQLAALDRDFAPPDSEKSDIPWSAVIRDLQRLLSEIGLYDGPIDGRQNAKLAAAIRRFEQRHGAIGEGLSHPGMLRRVMTVGAALRLRKTLEAVRKQQIEQAEDALRRNPATRDLLPGHGTSERSEHLPPLAASQTCLEKPTVPCLLHEAHVSANQVRRDTYRDWALREIIAAEARTGHFDRLRSRMRQISDPRLILVALREITQALAARGRVDEALDLADGIPDTLNRVRALAAIVIAQAKLGDRAKTRRLVERTFELLESDAPMVGRVAVATTLAAGLADAGALEEAKAAVALARRVASPATARMVRRVELGMITGALAETGQYQAAMEALAELASAPSQSAVAATASAVSRAGIAEAERYKVTTLCNLAVVQAKLGDGAAAAAILEQAEAVAGQIRKGYPAAYAWSRVAEAWAAAGNFEAAETIAGSLTDPLLRAQGFWTIEAARAQAGDLDGARFTEERARAETASVPSPFDRALILNDNAVVRAGAGRAKDARDLFDDALKLAQEVETRWWRARLFARLAGGLYAIELAGQKARSPR